MVTELARKYVGKVPLVPWQGMVPQAVQLLRHAVLAKTGYDFEELEITAAARRCTVPAIIAHAAGDELVLKRHSEALHDMYGAEGGGKSTLRLFAGDHNSVRPKEFTLQAIAFFAEHLKGVEEDRGQLARGQIGKWLFGCGRGGRLPEGPCTSRPAVEGELTHSAQGSAAGGDGSPELKQGAGAGGREGGATPPPVGGGFEHLETSVVAGETSLHAHASQPHEDSSGEEEGRNPVKDGTPGNKNIVVEIAGAAGYAAGALVFFSSSFVRPIAGLFGGNLHGALDAQGARRDALQGAAHEEDLMTQVSC